KRALNAPAQKDHELCSAHKADGTSDLRWPRPPFFDGHFLFHFSRKAEQVMTSTDPALWTRAPTTGFKVPLIARTMATKFSAMEKVMLTLMVVIIRLDRAMRWGSSFTSSSTRAMSAASTAMSLPTPS